VVRAASLVAALDAAASCHAFAALMDAADRQLVLIHCQPRSNQVSAGAVNLCLLLFSQQHYATPIGQNSRLAAPNHSQAWIELFAAISLT
jgi:hypothetical protein